MSQGANQYRQVAHYQHWGMSGYPMIPADVQLAEPEDDQITHEVSAELLQAIAKAIVAENNAVLTYARLVELAPTAATKQLLRDIRKDEKRHYRRFSAIYAAWTGGRTVDLLQPQLPPTFEVGIKQAIRIEVESAKFYREISHMTKIPYIERSFLDAAYDERRHAKLLMYIDSIH